MCSRVVKYALESYRPFGRTNMFFRQIRPGGKRDLTHAAKDKAVLCSDRRCALPLHSVFRPYIMNAVGCLILSNMTTCTGYVILAALMLDHAASIPLADSYGPSGWGGGGAAEE
jgi:Na+/H+-translocating membrane pyrophosphatase